MPVRWPWVSTGSLCCWWPQGPPALAGGFAASPAWSSQLQWMGCQGQLLARTPLPTLEMGSVVGCTGPRLLLLGAVAGVGLRSPGRAGAQHLVPLCHCVPSAQGAHGLVSPQIKGPSVAPWGAADGSRLFPHQHRARER